MRTIRPSLEEIRKRLMYPPVPSEPPRYIAQRRVVEVFPPAIDPPQEHSVIDLETADTETDFATESSSQAGLLIEQAAPNERTDVKVDDQPALETPKSLDGLARAVAELFEPARQCQGRLSEISAASESMVHLTRLAVELCEPLKSFHDHIRRLSSSFESMRTFRDELGALAESFAPVRALHQEVTQLAQTVRTRLAEVANGLEPAKALRTEIADLALAIDSVSDLQVQFYELSRAFGDGGTEPN
jgi:methyl-accepting chemotaxis protein